MGGTSGSIEVRPIQFPGDARAFVQTWWTIYAGDPCWVPPLYRDILGFLDPRVNPYFKVATIQPFMAFRGTQAVGTIAATVDHWTKDHHPGIGFFGFFEFVDDAEVASALFEAAATFLRGHGVHTMRGPFNFNLNHEFGLLVERFDDPPCVANPHNAHWYPNTYTKVLKLEKARDWYAYWMGYGPVPNKMKAISDRFLSRNPNVRIRPMDKRNFEKDCELFWDLYNDAWQENWGHTHMERDEFMYKALQMRPVLDEKLAFFAYVDDEPAGASITLPDYNQVAIHMNGRLFPYGWWHYARRDLYINRMRVLVLGVKQKFQHMPLGAPMYVQTWAEAVRRGTCRGVEASLIVEDNHRMRGALEKMGGIIHKTYRTYEKQIDKRPADFVASTQAEDTSASSSGEATGDERA